MSLIGYPTHAAGLTALVRDDGIARVSIECHPATKQLIGLAVHNDGWIQSPRSLAPSSQTVDYAAIHTRDLPLARFGTFGLRAKPLVKDTAPWLNLDTSDAANEAWRDGGSWPFAALEWMPGAQAKCTAFLVEVLPELFIEQLRLAWEHCSVVNGMAGDAKAAVARAGLEGATAHPGFRALPSASQNRVRALIAADQRVHGPNEEAVSLLAYMIREKWERLVVTPKVTDPLRILGHFETLTAGKFAASSYGNPRAGASTWGIHGRNLLGEFAKVDGILGDRYRAVHENRAAHSRTTFGAEGLLKAMSKLYKVSGLTELVGH